MLTLYRGKPCLPAHSADGAESPKLWTGIAVLRLFEPAERALEP